MSDFFTGLAIRALQPSGDVQPQLLSLFEPGNLRAKPMDGGAAGLPDERNDEEISPRMSVTRAPATTALTARLNRIDAILPSRANPPSPFAIEAPVSTNEVDAGQERPDESATLNRTTGTAALRSPLGRRTKNEVENPARTVPDVTTASIDIEAGSTHHAWNATASGIVAASPPVAPQVIFPQLPRSAGPMDQPRESVSHLMEPAPSAEPRIIQISIGRIEVRAFTSAPTVRSRASDHGPKAMTLDEYLNRKSAGGGP